MQREPRRWRAPFARRVQKYGVRRLTADLQDSGHPVTIKAVYDWVSGRCIPRPDTALAMTRLAGGRFQIGEIYAHREQLLRGTRVSVVR
jgi:hypothetical protein